MTSFFILPEILSPYQVGILEAILLCTFKCRRVCLRVYLDIYTESIEMNFFLSVKCFMYTAYALRRVGG